MPPIFFNVSFETRHPRFLFEAFDAMAKTQTMIARILFEDEISCPDIQAPTVFTGQRLNGTLQVDCGPSEEPSFDSVQLVLRGEIRQPSEIGF